MQKIQQLLTNYQKHMELRGFAPKTRLSYFQHVNYFLGLYPETVDRPNCMTVRDFLCSMSEGGASPSYIKIAYSSLKFFFQVTLGVNFDETKMPRLKKEYSIQRS